MEIKRQLIIHMPESGILSKTERYEIGNKGFHPHASNICRKEIHKLLYDKAIELKYWRNQNIPKTNQIESDCEYFILWRNGEICYSTIIIPLQKTWERMDWKDFLQLTIDEVNT